MITNAQLNHHFVSPRMRAYFHKKLSAVAMAEVDRRIEELLKYLNMAIYISGDIPFNEEVDEVWHLWILETLEYENLCKKLCGGQFMHHSSNAYVESDNPNIGKEKTDFKRALEILISYVHNYGGFTEDRIKYWPVAKLLHHRLNSDTEKFNGWLQKQLVVNGEVMASINTV